jgi:hypothetical protein
MCSAVRTAKYQRGLEFIVYGRLISGAVFKSDRVVPKLSVLNYTTVFFKVFTFRVTRL